ncbi:hypothetical protein ACWY4P_49235 [Streptomyces sp. LZ34]
MRTEPTAAEGGAGPVRLGPGHRRESWEPGQDPGQGPAGDGGPSAGQGKGPDHPSVSLPKAGGAIRAMGGHLRRGVRRRHRVRPEVAHLEPGRRDAPAG